MFKSAADRQAGLPPSGTAPITLQGHAGAVYDVAFTPAEEYILSCGADGTARLWSTELRSQIAAYSAHSAPVWCLSPAPRGHYFATGSFDRTARIWALDSGHPRRLCVGHAADVDSVAWHPSCNYIATGSSDRSVRVWDVASGECVRLLPGHGATPRSLAGPGPARPRLPVRQTGPHAGRRVRAAGERCAGRGGRLELHCKSFNV